MLTRAQIDRILTPVRPDRIESVRGMSYVAQHEVRAELARIFGPGNIDSHVHDVALIYEDSYDKDGKTYWKVCYRAACTLTIKDYEGNPICQSTEYHAEECAPQPSRGEAHALALTSVESYALRRAALNVAYDAVGLHLYRDGQQTALVRGTLMLTDKESPLYQEVTAPPVPEQVLTEEQRSVLANSLGASEVSTQ